MKNPDSNLNAAEAALNLRQAEKQLKTAKTRTKSAKKAMQIEKLKLKEAKKEARKAKKKVKKAKELLDAVRTAAAEAKRSARHAEKQQATAKHDTINSEQPAEAERSPSNMPTFSNPAPGPALSVIATIVAIVLLCLLSATAFSASPVEEMAKLGTTGGIDPVSDSWSSIQRSIEQFLHPEFILRLFLSLGLAVACAWVVALRPRRSTNVDSLTDLEERKTLIILGMVGAIVAELSGSSQTLAFVIFGIGALLRFRTALDNPKLTGKAITVVIIGLACGMGSWAMAVFVTAFSWLLIFWLDSHVSCRIKIRLEGEVDSKALFGIVRALLVSRRCRLQSSKLNEEKGQMLFMLHMPAGLDPKQLEADVRARLPESKITVEME